MISREHVEHIGRASRHAVPMGDDLIAVVLGDIKMSLDPHDRGITPHLAIDGFWESWVTAWVYNNVNPGMQCINVGANHGYYALLMAKLVGAKGRVLALEPMPHLHARIAQSVTMNGFWHLKPVQAAASDKNGRANITWSKSSAMNASLRVVDEPQELSSEVETVCVNTLLPRADIVFIDAEGWEPQVWEGARDVSALYVLEFSPHRYKDARGFAEVLKSTGKVSYIHTDGREYAASVDALLQEERMVVVRT